MLSDIHFVVQAVAKKDLDPSLCHFEIKDGRATGYGGRIALSSPIKLKFNVRPRAKPMWKALQATSETEELKLHMTGTGRLAVKQGKFSAYVDCLDQDFEMSQIGPTGERIEVTDTFYDSIKTLAPYISIDASRPWAQGLKLTANSIFATNNVVLVQHWHGCGIPIDCIIPHDAVIALVKIGQAPVAISVGVATVTFHFENERWLCTHLIAQDGGWSRAEQLFDMHMNADGLEPVGEDFYEALDTLKDLLGERKLVYLKGDRICTSPNDEEGASIDSVVPNGPIFHSEPLRSLREIATKVNFTTYPKPCYFIGDRLRGIIVGLTE